MSLENSSVAPAIREGDNRAQVALEASAATLENTSAKSSEPDDGSPTTKRQRTDNALSKTKALGSDVLTLDIGGEKTVKTLRSTLTFTNGSKLAETFSGRWDNSLPRNKEGDFFIDYKPELFMPLLDFLRTLSSITTTVSESPPMTPSYKDLKDEQAFRTMVDAFGLTNVLYNYEIFESDVCDNFSLDRPDLQFGACCHTRQVRSFTVLFKSNSNCFIGWIRRGKVFANDSITFYLGINVVAFDANTRQLIFIDRTTGFFKKCEPIDIAIGRNSELRCCRNVHTDELEWHIDGSLVIATSKALGHGEEVPVEMRDGVCRLGWTDDCEMIPCVEVLHGTCRFTALELEA
ncbi:hypothetical protein MPSEU_000174800 [Mayamaea pseudoterrestris]|nr:hypothetical protein MPSEU_000174800 [Mayamaea pseudoterrestris]